MQNSEGIPDRPIIQGSSDPSRKANIQHSQNEDTSVVIMLRDEEKVLGTEDNLYVTGDTQGCLRLQNVYKDRHVHFSSAPNG